jgi:hypothetical protein
MPFISTCRRIRRSATVCLSTTALGLWVSTASAQSGVMHGGEQPVTGSHVYMFAASPSGVIASVQFPQYYAGSAVNPLNAVGKNYTAGIIPVQNWNIADTDTGTSPVAVSSGLVSSTGAATSFGYTYSGFSYNDGANDNNFASPMWYQPGGYYVTDILGAP